MGEFDSHVDETGRTLRFLANALRSGDLFAAKVNFKYSDIFVNFDENKELGFVDLYQEVELPAFLR